MKKRILRWLFGKDFKDYLELLDKHIETLDRCKESLEKEQVLRKKLIKEIESHSNTLDITKIIIEENKKLRQYCKENGIEISTRKENTHET